MTGRERPTAPSDVSWRASGAPADRLAIMRMGYVRVRRVEHCACGSDVIQDTGQTPTEAVREHNATRRHQAWRMRLVLWLMTEAA